MVLAWFIKETGAPIQLKSASWDVRISELFKGKIRNLKIDLFYEPLDTSFKIETPVNFVHQQNHWSIQLKPLLKTGNLPAAKGSIDLQLDIERKGSKAQAHGAEITFRLHEVAPLLLTPERDVTIAIARWQLDGDLTWDPLNQNKAERLYSELTLTLGGIEADLGGISLREPQLKFDSRLHFAGQNLETVDISVDKPFQLSATGKLTDGHLKTRVSFKASLDELLNKRIIKWLEPKAPDLFLAKASGTLGITGTIDKPPGKELAAQGNVKLIAEKISVPLKKLKVQNLKLTAPLKYPADANWGRLLVELIEFNSVKIKNIDLTTRLTPTGIDLTTEDASGTDRPIRQSVWGGIVDISNLYSHIGKDSELVAAVFGGPFKISEIQRDLCIFPNRPVSGSLSFTYPQIVHDQDSLKLVGDLNLTVFNGTAHIGDLNLFLKGKNPRLSFNLDWNDLDLHSIGQWTGIGDMRGSLDGLFSKANFALTPLGPVPLSYELTVKGRERSGKKISFYGRAVDSILELLGSRKTEMPWYAAGILEITMLWRNLMPSTVEYMGFKAVSNGDWTELSTFDPPDAKKHYMLYGTTFTIPLETHGYYPVRLKSAAFQGWLWGMIEYFKGRFKNEASSGEKECKPLW
ncbi:MAG: hypothetical protein AB1540_09940 [Bdellovibrionota bacterium]